MLATATTEHAADIGAAKEIAETLHAHYPGHLWAVTIQGGVAIIKALNISSLWGYVLKQAHIQHDAGLRHRAVMRAGGEILERAAMARAAYNGQKAKAVEGIADYKPIGVH